MGGNKNVGNNKKISEKGCGFFKRALTGFSIEYVIFLHYSHTGSVYRGVFTAQDFRSFSLDPDLPPYGTMPFNGGFPQGEYDGTGIIIHGSDANGAPMVFHAYVEFP